jgi:pSer/pThr/pTyr-binding forkhead associated (FHA) protein
VSNDTVLVEIIGSHGHVQSRERITVDAARSFTIGRAVDADVTLDDPYCAALHARITVNEDGALTVTDPGSVNGVLVGGKRVRGAEGLALPGGLLQVGHTRLRIRSAQETLAPERPDRVEPSALLRQPAWIAGMASLICVAQVLYGAWVGAPRDLATTAVTALVSSAVGATAWVALWALLSRVMQGDWRWLRHAAIFLGVAAAFVALEGLLELAWFTFSLPQWNLRVVLLGALAFGVVLYLHLRHASNLGSRSAAFVACVVPALSAGLSHWLLERSHARDVNHIATVQRIYPPALRATTAGSLEDYFRATAELRVAADRRRKAMPGGDEGADADDDD